MTAIVPIMACRDEPYSCVLRNEDYLSRGIGYVVLIKPTLSFGHKDSNHVIGID